MYAMYSAASPKSSTSWATIVRPELLFLIGGVFGISSYVKWFLFGKNLDYSYSITGIPAVYWVVGYLSFFVGSMKWLPIRVRRVQRPLIGSVDRWRTNGLLVVLLVGLAIQIYLIFSLYGGIPLLLFFSGDLDVESVNQAQLSSGFGQIGFLFVTLILLQGMLLIEIIRANAAGVPRPIRILSLVFFIFLLHLSAGKRQGIFIATAFIVCGLSLSIGNPFAAFLRAIGLQVTRFRVIGFFVAIIAILFAAFEITGSIRTGSESEHQGLELFTYVELPLINLEAQSEQMGLTPNRLDISAIFVTLLPAKIRDEVMRGIRLPTLPEPTAPTGFFGSVQWFGGLTFAALFALLAGLICKWLYVKSRDSLAALLCYSQISWALLSAHTYNHFLNLVFVPLPMGAFLVVAWLVTRHRLNRLGSNPEQSRLSASIEAKKPVGRE